MPFEKRLSAFKAILDISLLKDISCSFLWPRPLPKQTIAFRGKLKVNTWLRQYEKHQTPYAVRLSQRIWTAASCDKMLLLSCLVPKRDHRSSRFHLSKSDEEYCMLHSLHSLIHFPPLSGITGSTRRSISPAATSPCITGRRPTPASAARWT